MPREGTKSGLHNCRMCELCICITACLAACRSPDRLLLTPPCSTANALPDAWVDTAAQRRPLSLRNAARGAPCAQAPRVLYDVRVKPLYHVQYNPLYHAHTLQQSTYFYIIWSAEPTIFCPEYVMLYTPQTILRA